MDSPTASPKGSAMFVPDYSFLNPTHVDIASAESTDVLIQRPLYGKTLFLSALDIVTRVGNFRLLVFQNLLTSAYVMAVVSARGDIRNATRLYTRAHSSCISSETLHGVDCDCVQQLHGALKRIADSEEGGILFYLLQEGRGTAYPIKARGIMLTQHSRETINTFQSYSCMGLQPDYRDYSTLADIAVLMNLRKDVEWVLLSNNPDKVQGLSDIGFNVVSVANLEFNPGPFNAAYLKSKAKSGHHLMLTKQKKAAIGMVPSWIEPTAPFEPYVLPHASRFIYTANYLLPMRPVSRQIILSAPDYKEFYSMLASVPHEHEHLRGNRHLVRFSGETEVPQFLRDKPYWFRVHVYRDIVLNSDFVLLQYFTPEVDCLDIPVVRLQSESLLNRFPLKKDEPSFRPRRIFRRSVEAMVRHGAGFLLLYPTDARGLGFASLTTHQMFKQFKAKHESDPKVQSLTVGVNMERDYVDRDAAVELLRHHNIQAVQLVSHTKSGRQAWTESLTRVGIRIHRYLDVESTIDPQGHNMLLHRTTASYDTIKDYIRSLEPLVNQTVDDAQNKDRIKLVAISGAGACHAIAMYFVHLIRTYTRGTVAEFVPFNLLNDFIPADHFDSSQGGKSVLVVLSQGMSPHSTLALREDVSAKFNRTIVITGAEDSDVRGNLTSNVDSVETFKLAVDKETGLFIRTLGPLCMYVALQALTLQRFSDVGSSKKLPNVFTDVALRNELLRSISQAFSKMPSEAWTQCVALRRRPVHILARHPWPMCGGNISLKFSEGIFIHQPVMNDFLEFAHGPLQQDHADPKAYLILCGPEDKKLVETVLGCLPKDSPVWILESTLPESLRIVEWECVLNEWLLKAVDVADVDQRSYPGAGNQSALYRLVQW